MELEELNAAELLCSEIRHRFPSIEVGRPSRVYDSISQKVAPTMPSLRGTAKLAGSPLASYRRPVWLTRIRNTHAGETVF